MQKQKAVKTQPAAVGVPSVTVTSAEGWVAPTAGNLLVAVHAIGVNPANALVPAGWTRPAGGLATRSTFNGVQVCYRTADGTETSITFGTSTSNNAQSLQVFEFPAPFTWVSATPTDSGGSTESLDHGDTAALPAGTKGVLAATHTTSAVVFGPAPFGAKTFDDTVEGNGRLTVSFKDETSTAAQSGVQTFTPATGSSGVIAAFTYTPVAPSSSGWRLASETAWVSGPTPTPSEVTKLGVPMFGNRVWADGQKRHQLGLYVNNHTQAANRTQADWDRAALWYRYMHQEGHNWSRTIDADGLSVAEKFTAGRATHFADVYVNGSYISQAPGAPSESPLWPWAIASHAERMRPLGLATMSLTTDMRLSTAMTETSTSLVVTLPTTKPSGLPATHPNGTPAATFWPLVGSTKAPVNDVFSKTTSDYLSWVRIGGEIVGLPPYTSGAWTVNAAGTVATITGVFRGLWRTERETHAAGVVVRAPIWIGSDSAVEADKRLSGNPIVNSNGALRYALAYYSDSDRGGQRDGLAVVADTLVMEQRGLQMNAVKTVTSVAANGTITATAHGFANGDQVAFGGSDVAGGVRTLTPYHVRDVTTNTFKVSLTAGGPVLEVNKPPREWAFGTWVLQQINSPAAWAQWEPQISAALDEPGCVGYSMRMQWDVWEQYPELVDTAYALTVAKGKKFSFRFMAGRHTPARVFDNGAHFYMSEGFRHPKPFSNDGVAGNPVFEAEYEAAVARLAAWSRERGVRLMHLAWYGWKWSEFMNGTDLVAAAGYSWPAALGGARRLALIAKNYAGYDLAAEYSVSGHYDDPAVNEYNDLTAMGSNLAGNFYEGLITQGNNMSDQPNTMGAPAPALGLYHAKQSVSSTDNTYDWNAIYDAYVARGWQYLEVYTAQWTGGTSATLKSRAAALLAAHTYTAPPVTDMVVAKLLRPASDPIADATELDVTSTSSYNNSDAYGNDIVASAAIVNQAYSYSEPTQLAAGPRQRAKRAALQQRLVARGMPSDHKLIANNLAAAAGQFATGEKTEMVRGGEYDGYLFEHFLMTPASMAAHISQMALAHTENLKAIFWAKVGDFLGGAFSSGNPDAYIRVNYGAWLLTWRETSTAPILMSKWYTSSVTERPSDTTGHEVLFWDFGMPSTQPGGKPTNPASAEDLHQPAPGLYMRQWTKGVVLVNTTVSPRTFTLPVASFDALSEVNRNGEVVPVPAGSTVTVPAYDAAFYVTP